MPTAIDGIEQVSPSGGGGGGAVTIADGADVAEGATSDAAWGGIGNGSVISILKRLATLFTGSGVIGQGPGAGFPILTGWEQYITDGSGTGVAKVNNVAPAAGDIGLTVRNIPSGTQPVSGTFFQATQPISAAALPLPAGAAIEAGHLATIDTKTPALGQALAAACTPVVLPVAQIITLTPPAAITGFALDATLTNKTQFTKLTDGTRDALVKAASTLPLLTDTAIVTTQRDPLPAGTNVLGHVIVDPPTLTKGTQSATGFSVQDLKDAGRNTRIFMLDTITAAPVAEALATVVQWYGNAAVGGTTQPAVIPAGKVLRLTGYKIQYQSLATVGYAVIRIRFNIGGLVVIGSPLVASFEAGSGSGATTVAMTGGITTETGSFPEGLELPAGGGIGFSVAGYGPTGTLTLEGGVRFEVHGYEY